jgi:hypothetical protein
MNDNSPRKKTWIVVGVSTVLLFILFPFFIDLGDLARLFRTINWWEVVVVSAALLVGYIFLTLRLRYILLNKAGWWETFYANSIGFMYHIALFVPAMVGRVVAIGAVTPISMPQAYSALLVERLLEQVMRLSAVILALFLLSSKQVQPAISVGGTMVLVIALFGAIFWTVRRRKQVIEALASRLSRWGYSSEAQIRSTASTMLQSLDAVSSTRRLIISLLLSLAAWISFYAFYALVLAALPLPLGTNQRLLTAAVVLVVMPPSINVMLIVYHIVVIALLVTFQLTNPTVAAAYAITLHLVQMICWIILGTWASRQTGLDRHQMINAVKIYVHKGSEETEAGNA